MANVFDPTQPQGGLSLEDLINEPGFLEALGMAPMADMNAPVPEGMNVGGTFKAAHPLQAVAAIGQRIAGGLNAKKLNEVMARLLRGRYGAPASQGGTTPEELVPPQEL